MFNVFRLDNIADVSRNVVETEESSRNRLHLDAINEHLRYIYDRMDDLIKRIEKLELIHRV